MRGKGLQIWKMVSSDRKGTGLVPGTGDILSFSPLYLDVAEPL